MRPILVFAIYFLLTGSNALGAVVKHTFEVSYISGSPDGVLKNNILGINGQFPGPTIEATVGDTIEVTLLNKIQDGQNVTIHWHGILQNGTPYEDGTSQITQCPLPYGSFQVYRFQVTQPGTFWYHSHVNSQYTEGLFGAFIVHSPQEQYHSDGELTLVLHDWYHRSAHENEAWFLSPLAQAFSPYPDSGLINGLGRYPCNLAELQNRSCSTDQQHRYVFTVQQNTTYRVRIINAAALTFFDFSIDNHAMEAIEVDGLVVVKPIAANVATIAPGQRYSFLVKFQERNPEVPEENHKFLIRSTVRKDILDLNLGPVENINKYPAGFLSDTTAVLHPVERDLGNVPHRVEVSSEQFSHENVIPPPVYGNVTEGGSSGQNVMVYLNQMELLPLDGISAPEHVDQEFTINGGLIADADGITRHVFNGTRFQLPHDKPLLFSLVEDGKLPEHALPLEIHNGSVVQIVINTEQLIHPFHLHGHHFWVVGIGEPGDGQYDPSRHQLSMITMKRDTIVPQSWAVLRFVANNPGVWTFHCHMDWHNLGGMALTIVESADIVRAEFRPSAEALRICQLHK